MESFAAEPTSALRSVVGLKGMSRGTVRKVLKLPKYHPYKIKVLQQLHEDDYDVRIKICENMFHRLNAILNILFNICSND